MSWVAGESSQSWSWDTALYGVIPPLISPLTDSGDPDEAVTGRLVEHILAGAALASSCSAAAARARG